MYTKQTYQLGYKSQQAFRFYVRTSFLAAKKGPGGEGDRVLFLILFAGGKERHVHLQFSTILATFNDIQTLASHVTGPAQTTVYTFKASGHRWSHEAEPPKYRPPSIVGLYSPRVFTFGPRGLLMGSLGLGSGLGSGIGLGRFGFGRSDGTAAGAVVSSVVSWLTGHWAGQKCSFIELNMSPNPRLRTLDSLPVLLSTQAVSEADVALVGWSSEVTRLVVDSWFIFEFGDEGGRSSDVVDLYWSVFDESVIDGSISSGSNRLTFASDELAAALATWTVGFSGLSWSSSFVCEAAWISVVGTTWSPELRGWSGLMDWSDGIWNASANMFPGAGMDESELERPPEPITSGVAQSAVNKAIASNVMVCIVKSIAFHTEF